MIKITDMLAALPQLAREAMQGERATDHAQAKEAGATALAQAYPSKKLALKNGQYVATDHEK